MMYSLYRKIKQIVLFFIITGALSLGAFYNNFVVIVASYNNAKYYKKNLDSIFDQDYPEEHYRVIYTDDCSSDGTFDLVKSYVSKSKKNHIFTLVKNKERLGSPLENHYNMLKSCKNNEIAVLVDGDDWLIGSDVLSYLNDVYKTRSVDLTYGSYVIYGPNQKCIGVCKELPDKVKEKSLYRKHFSENFFYASHLKTFKISLFNKINIFKFKDNGVFFKIAGDVALMCALLEKCEGKVFFIDKILYGYNVYNPINELKIYDTHKAVGKIYNEIW